MTENEIASLFLKFSMLDRDGQGLMTRNDFFIKFLEEQRHFFGDAIFNLIGRIRCFPYHITELMMSRCCFLQNQRMKKF